MNKILIAAFKENNTTISGSVLTSTPSNRGSNTLQIKIYHPTDRKGEIVLKRAGYVDLYT